MISVTSQKNGWMRTGMSPIRKLRSNRVRGGSSRNMRVVKEDREVAASLSPSA
jgi:hypothetical protein